MLHFREVGATPGLTWIIMSEPSQECKKNLTIARRNWKRSGNPFPKNGLAHTWLLPPTICAGQSGFTNEILRSPKLYMDCYRGLKSLSATQCTKRLRSVHCVAERDF